MQPRMCLACSRDQENKNDVTKWNVIFLKYWHVNMLSCQSHFTLLVFHSPSNTSKFCDLYQFVVGLVFFAAAPASRLMHHQNIHHYSVVACDALTSVMSLSPCHIHFPIRRRHFHMLEYQRRLPVPTPIRWRRRQCPLMWWQMSSSGINVPLRFGCNMRVTRKLIEFILTFNWKVL